MLNSIKRFVSRMVPRSSARQYWRQIWDGYLRHQSPQVSETNASQTQPGNPLSTYFDAHREGRGIWKWRHYFDIYHRHFNKFRGRAVNVLEIGVYSGGSLDMWRHYFGPQCRVFGVDIEPDCKIYEDDSVKVLIGDQADRGFWQNLRKQIPRVDIIIDDGGHEAHQQIPTLEEMLPHLREGGVYLCEDLHGAFNGFACYMTGFVQNLNQFEPTDNMEDHDRRIVCGTSQFQSVVHSVHFYPFVVVIEKSEGTLTEFIAPMHGTQWQPFLK
jgi:23S rRNA U2552 (ribose-2'-O)-methylase RlmE/FtsJ